MSDLGFHAQTSLSISNISAIFRRGWLARKLKISVRELLVLLRYSGLDPFAVPDLTDPAILRLIRLIQALKNSSLKSSVLLYVMWNQDLSGKSAPDPAHIAELARSLRNDFAAIDEQFAAVEDPNGDVARARMTLVYGQETADQFFALLDATLVVDVSYTHSAQALENAILAAYPRIMYDAFRHRLEIMLNEKLKVRSSIGFPDLPTRANRALSILHVQTWQGNALKIHQAKLVFITISCTDFRQSPHNNPITKLPHYRITELPNYLETVLCPMRFS